MCLNLAFPDVLGNIIRAVLSTYVKVCEDYYIFNGTYEPLHGLFTLIGIAKYAQYSSCLLMMHEIYFQVVISKSLYILQIFDQNIEDAVFK